MYNPRSEILITVVFVRWEPAHQHVDVMCLGIEVKGCPLSFTYLFWPAAPSHVGASLELRARSIFSMTHMQCIWINPLPFTKLVRPNPIINFPGVFGILFHTRQCCFFFLFNFTRNAMHGFCDTKAVKGPIFGHQSYHYNGLNRLYNSWSSK